jgi:glycosyltransferase involved in cell wall biosynthesis
MRVAVVTNTCRRIGGIETYIETLVAELAATGHDVALWHESTGPETRALMALPDGVVSSPINTVRLPAMIDGWRPEGIVVNCLDDPTLESMLLSEAGALFVAHNYHGVCISGTRAWGRPEVRPCTRRFGPGCLAHYFPHRCGGRSLVTMTRLYRRERRRQTILKRAVAVVALSAYVREVYLANGWEPSRVVHVPFGLEAAPRATAEPGAAAASADGVLELATVGRLERLKGVHLLLDALPTVRARTGRGVALTVIGDGSSRAELEQHANRIRTTTTDVEIAFLGWLSPEERDRRLRNASLVIVPSAWPEPLGLVGAEAGALGLPVVAFDVGGIGEWLIDGVNGRLVPADPPSAPPLADAIAALANNPAAIARMSSAARETARRRSVGEHARAIVDLCERLHARSSAAVS